MISIEFDFFEFLNYSLIKKNVNNLDMVYQIKLYNLSSLCFIWQLIGFECTSSKAIKT